MRPITVVTVAADGAHVQGNPVLQGTHNAARRIVDGLTFVSDTVTDYSKKPTRIVSNWVTDRIAPPYWTPNAVITVRLLLLLLLLSVGWLGSRVVSVLGAVEPRFKLQPRLCQVTVLGKLFTPIVPLFTKRRIGSSPLKGCEGDCRPGRK